jgi:hypothetical protein
MRLMTMAHILSLNPGNTLWSHQKILCLLGEMMIPLFLLTPVLAENAHPFKDPPLRMNNPSELSGLTT